VNAVINLHCVFYIT